MNKFVGICLLATVLFPAQRIVAQDKPPEKSAEKQKADEQAKVTVPVRMQIVFTEQDGDKKVSSMPYSFATNARSVNYEQTSIRDGVRIPVETDGKDQKTTYLDLGSNIDCRVLPEEDGRFRVNLIFEHSSIYPGNTAGQEKLDITRPNGLPLIRSFRTNENFILRDGQTSESVLSTDPISGHTLRVSVTLNVQK